MDMSDPNNPFVLKEDDTNPGGGNGSDFPLGLPNRDYTILIQQITACGTLEAETVVTAPPCSGGGGGARIAAFPNPASSSLNVQVTDSLSTDTGTTLDQPYDLNIMDRFSRKVFSAQSSEKILEIPVSNFPPDIYYLNLFYKDAILQEQVIIKR
jgi:hypothetical protein